MPRQCNAIVRSYTALEVSLRLLTCVQLLNLEPMHENY